MREKSRKPAQEINQTIGKIKKIKNVTRDKETNEEPPKFNYYCSDGKTIDDFGNYTDLREFGRDIQNGLTTLDEAKESQRNMRNKIKKLKTHTVKTYERKDYKSKVLKNVDILYKGIRKIIKGFEDGDFLIKDFGEQTEDDKQDEGRTFKK